MNQQQKIDKMAAALRDCVRVFSSELDGLKVIQPELRQAEQALDCLDIVDAEMPIDCSQAPAGTTHKRIDDFRFPWRMLRKGLWHSWNDGWMVVKPGDPDLYVARPSVEWNGEGLPPVGLKVEGLIDGIGNWCELTLKYKSTDFSVFERADGEEFPLWNPQYSTFRPIRTPEQIEAEEREKAIEEMVTLSPMLDKGWARKVCTAVYDAGYRKQVAE